MAPAKYRQIVEAATVEDGGDRTLIYLEVNREVNQTGGRASDAARCQVADYARMGADAYRERFAATRENTIYG